MKSKKTLIIASIILVMGTTLGCSHKSTNGEQQLSDSIAHMDSITKMEEDSIAKDKEVVKLIKRMFNEELYADDTFVHKHCTKKLQKQIAEAEEDSEGSIFLSEAQDGPSEKMGIIDVIPMGNSWYKYRFYDMGNMCVNKMKVVEDEDQIKFDEVVRLQIDAQ